MANRTQIKTISFKWPFQIEGYEGLLPAGDYQVETEEEPLQGVTFTGYRRVLTLLHLHPRNKKEKFGPILKIDPNDLDAALIKDLASRGPGECR